MLDNSKVTYLVPPPEQINYIQNYNPASYKWRESWRVKTFVSHLCHWILNVSQALDVWYNKKISIPINPQNVEERLMFQQILADIVLYQLITWDNDRHITYDNDDRAKDWNVIKWHNCIIFREWTYSIFDIFDFWSSLSKEKVLEEIIISVRDLLENYYMDDQDQRDHIFLWFFDRMLVKVDMFLELYWWETWRKFFLRQVAHSRDPEPILHDIQGKDDIWYDMDIERYEALIYTLNNIREVISIQNIEEEILDYMYWDYDFLKKELKTNLEKGRDLLFRILKFWIPNKIKKNYGMNLCSERIKKMIEYIAKK